MSAKQEVIITCAVTGSADTPSKNRAVPVTPEEIVRSAVDAARAGAAVIHLHVRDPETTKASMDLELYRRVYCGVRESGTDVIVNLTTGPGGRFIPSKDDPRIGAAGTTLTTPEERVRHVVELRPEMCSLDVATMATGGAYGEAVLINTPRTIRVMATAIREAGSKPELEVFDTGHVRLATYLVEEGLVEPPAFFQFCLGIEWGAPATPSSIEFLRALIPSDSPWAAFGVGAAQFPMVAQAVLAGGHVRVGLEDNLYLARGELAPSNAALVERAVQIIELLGASVASPARARALLGLET